MPDYAMCANETCPLARRCFRSPESGTVPSEFRQSWSKFEPDQSGESCSHFIVAPRISGRAE